MKMNSKLISIALALIVLLSLAVCVSAEADTTVGFAVTHSTGYVKAGDEITVSLDVTKNPGLRAGTIDIKWDTEVLTLLGVADDRSLSTEGSVFEVVFAYMQPKTKSVKVTIGNYGEAFGSKAPVYSNTGKVMDLTFKVNEDIAADAETLIEVVADSDSIVDKDGNMSYTVELSSQKLTYHPTCTLVEVAGKDATCTETGLTVGEKCSVCGAVTVEQKVISALGHTEVTLEGKDASCDTDGLSVGKKCTVCNTVTVEQKVIPAYGHDWVEVIDKEPTMDANGEKHEKCENCGKIRNEGTVIPMLKCEHKWTDATCTDPKTCSVCKATEGEALGHTWTDATCTDPKTCSVCKATEGEALGHTWTDATCTAPKTCSVCKATEGEAAAHKFGDWTTVKEAAEGVDGEEKRTCSACDKAETRAIPALPASGPNIWLIVAIAVVAVGAIAVVVVLIVGKKKKQAV